MIFPEGTRHVDGRVHAFHQGFAFLAKKLNRPVIPIAISGMDKMYPRGSKIIDSSCKKVIITIGEPIKMPVGETIEDFVHTVHRWFVDTIQ